jgi:IPT/TIG domain
MGRLNSYFRHPIGTRRWLARVSSLFSVGLAAALLFPGVANAAGTGSARTWTAVPSSNLGDSANELSSVSCTGSSFCMAVGYYSANGSSSNDALMESWDGSFWSLQLGNSPSASFNEMYGVSCTSPSFCVAVGTDEATGGAFDTLIQTWNGSVWTTVTSPSPGSSNFLWSVDCISSTFCAAAGDYYNGSTDVPLTEMWNGTSWSLSSSPAKGSEAWLRGVACTGAKKCEAAGAYTSNDVDHTLIESWNGTAWSVSSSPNSGVSDNDFFGISCVSSADCYAAGTAYSSSSVPQNLVESWNGTTWSIASTPNQGKVGDSLNGLSCNASGSCQAVGYFETASHQDRALGLVLEGSEWSITPTSLANTGSSTGFAAASCPTSSFCMAVGTSSTDSTIQALAEQFNGSTWSVTSAGNVDDAFDQLTGVSCVSSSLCISVGSYTTSAGAQTLAELWNGSGWSVMASTNPSDDDFLEGVTCTSSTSCVAVGATSNGSDDQTLIENWNGSTWSTATSPSVGGTDNVLYGVSCGSSTNCVAVGSYDDGGDQATLSELWNGTSWSIGSSENENVGDYLTAISCVSAGVCTAVGFYSDASLGSQPLIETLSGTNWSTASTPNEGTNDELSGVSCTSSSSCMAAGSYYNGSTYLTVIERWNGSNWSIVPSTNAAGPSFLNGVSCSSSSKCFAVGRYGTTEGQFTLVESWNGSAWSTTNSAPVGILQAVSCTASSVCQAVGYDGGDDTLAEASPAAAPTISSFSPTSGSVGTQVTIHGSNLGHVSKVLFGSTLAPVLTHTSGEVVAVVPSGATTGKIRVVTPGGSVTSSGTFTVS